MLFHRELDNYNYQSYTHIMKIHYRIEKALVNLNMVRHISCHNFYKYGHIAQKNLIVELIIFFDKNSIVVIAETYWTSS